MSYNVTFMDSSTNLLQVMTSVNAASGNLFGFLFLSVLWIASFIIFQREDKMTAFMASNFITSVIGIMLLLLKIVTWQIIILPLLALFFSIIFMNITQ